VGADGVVNGLPVAEFAIELFHFQRAGCDLVELLGVGAVGASDGAVTYAEPFLQKEVGLVVDLLAIPVKSI